MRQRALLLVLFGLLMPLAASGTETPPIALPEMTTGRTVTLEALRGQVVYLDFWASWCGPCRKSLPLYEQMRQELPREGVRIVAINLDESRADVEHFLERHPVSYTVLLDPAGVSADQWQIEAMPSSFLLDAEGNVVRSWAGFQTDHLEEIRNAILELVR